MGADSLLCTCFSVDEAHVRALVASGCTTLEALRRRCRAGRDCGMCLPELRRLLRRLLRPPGGSAGTGGDAPG